MGKYIGQTPSYGNFERQTITIIPGTTQYTLSQRVSNETSMLVSCERLLLTPVTDYTIVNVDGSQKIQFNVDLAGLDGDNTDSTTVSIVFLSFWSNGF